MAKNLILGLVFACFGPNLVPSFFFFFCRCYLNQMLYIVANYHCMQFQGKPKNQTLENGKKPSFGPNFCPVGPNSACHFFFFFQTSGSVSHQIPWSANIMYSMRKPNDPMLRKLSYESTDGEMDRRMRVILQDTTTNVERPKMKLGFKVCFVKILMFSQVIRRSVFIWNIKQLNH